MWKPCLFLSILLIYSSSGYIVPSYPPTAITGNAVFANSNSPYYITANTVVDTANSLTIEPGVNIFFSYQVSLLIRGTLIAVGNSTNLIKFTAANTANPWANLQIASASVTISYCSLSYGGSGSGSNGMLYVKFKLA